jgi:hypothetical protein
LSVLRAQFVANQAQRLCFDKARDKVLVFPLVCPWLFLFTSRNLYRNLK